MLTGVAMFMLWYSLGETPAPSGPAKTPEVTKGQPGPVIAPPPPSQQGPVVDVTHELPGEQTALPSSEQVQRNELYGLEKSLNAVVRSDESIKLGDQQVPVAERERKLVVEGRGALLDKPIGKNQQ